MGFWSTLFSGSDSDESGQTIKVREHKESNNRQGGDRYTHVGEGKHVHESYDLDKASGSYREYHGGENSGDRSYNQGSDSGQKK